MEYNRFNQLVVAHRNSMILIGVLVLLFIIIGSFVVKLFFGKELSCLKIGKIKISPIFFMLIPLILAIVFFSVEVYKCNYDIDNLSYETYIGEVEYSESSVKLIDINVSIFVGKWHEICPRGNSYGMVIYSTKSHVIVFYQEQKTS